VVLLQLLIKTNKMAIRTIKEFRYKAGNSLKVDPHFSLKKINLDIHCSAIDNEVRAII